MLVDIQNEWCQPYADRWNKYLEEKPIKGLKPYQFPSEFRIQKGVYSGYFSDVEIGDHLITEYPWDPFFIFNQHDYDNFDDCVKDRFAEMRRQWNLDYPFEVPSCYGIADNLEQVLLRWPIIETSYRKLVLLGHVEHKKTSGFRWHKHGEYIGTQNRQGYEYHRDEPEVGDVYLWRLWEVKE